MDVFVKHEESHQMWNMCDCYGPLSLAHANQQGRKEFYSSNNQAQKLVQAYVLTIVNTDFRSFFGITRRNIFLLLLCSLLFTHFRDTQEANL